MVTITSPQIYTLSPEYSTFVEDVDCFRAVILKKLGELGAKLPQLSGQVRTQAKADLVYLKAIVEGAEPAEAQISAGAVFSAKEHFGPLSPAGEGLEAQQQQQTL